MVCEQVQRSISRSDGRLQPRARAHVRDCAACAAFAAAIPTRRAGLQALAPPLAPIQAAALLAVLHGATSTQGAGGGGVMAAGLSGKTAGAALAAKALASVAIVAVASASATGAVPPLTGSGEASVNATSPARASAPERTSRHLRRSGGTRAPRARRGAAHAPTRSDAKPAATVGALAVGSTSNASGVSSGPAGTAGQAKSAGAAVSSQGRPSGGGVPVHTGHPHGAGALHGKPPAGASHARGSGAAGGARGAHESGAATGRGRELPGATSANAHSDGGHGRASEPASAGGEHGRPGEASNALPPHIEPPSSAGETQPPPAHEEAGSHRPDGQHGGPVASSPPASDR